MFDSGVCLHFNKGNELNKKKSKVEPRKIKIVPEQTPRLFLEKIITTYIILFKFHGKFMFGLFSIKLTQFEKTGLIGIAFIPLQI